MLVVGMRENLPTIIRRPEVIRFVVVAALAGISLGASYAIVAVLPENSSGASHDVSSAQVYHPTLWMRVRAKYLGNTRSDNWHH